MVDVTDEDWFESLTCPELDFYASHDELNYRCSVCLKAADGLFQVIVHFIIVLSSYFSALVSSGELPEP